MIKRISFIRRKEGMSREDFFAHWTGPHADIVRQMPGLRGLRFGRGAKLESRRRPRWDGVGELWFDSIEDARSAFATEPFAVAARRGPAEIHARGAVLLRRGADGRRRRRTGR